MLRTSPARNFTKTKSRNSISFIEMGKFRTNRTLISIFFYFWQQISISLKKFIFLATILCFSQSLSFCQILDFWPKISLLTKLLEILKDVLFKLLEECKNHSDYYFTFIYVLSVLESYINRHINHLTLNDRRRFF